MPDLSIDPQQFLAQQGSKLKIDPQTYLNQRQIPELGGNPQILTPQQVTQEGSPNSLNSAIDFIRPFVGNAAGLGAASLAGLVTANPYVAGGADTQGYAVADTLMQYLKSGTERPSSFGSAVAKAEAEAAANAIGGKIIGALFRGAGSVAQKVLPNSIYNFDPTTAQALESYGWKKLGSLAKFAEDFGATGAKNEALDRTAGQGFTQQVKLSNLINGRTQNTNTNPVLLLDKIKETLGDAIDDPASFFKPPKNPRLQNSQLGNLGPNIQMAQDAIDELGQNSNPLSTLDSVIKNPDRLGKVLAVAQAQGTGTNLKQDLQVYQFMRMMEEASTKDPTGKVTRIDPQVLTNIWRDADSKTALDALWGKSGRETITNFINNIKSTQGDLQAYPIAKQARIYGNGLALGWGLLQGNISGAMHSAGAIAGLYLPLGAVGTLLTKPNTAKFVLGMLGEQPLDKSKEYVARSVMSALQGTTVALLDGQGNKQWVQIEPDSKNGGYKFVEPQIGSSNSFQIAPQVK